MYSNKDLEVMKQGIIDYGVMPDCFDTVKLINEIIHLRKELAEGSEIVMSAAQKIHELADAFKNKKLEFYCDVSRQGKG